MQSYTFEELAERWLLSALKTTEEAERQFRRSGNRPPDVGRMKDLIEEASGQLREAIGQDEGAATEVGGETIDCRTVSARLLKLAGDVLTSKGSSADDQHEGIHNYKQYLDEYDPEDVKVLLSLAEAHLRVDQYDEAEATLRRALDCDPTNRRAEKLLQKLPKYTASLQDRPAMQIPVPSARAQSANSVQPYRPNQPLQGEIILPGQAVCHHCGHPQPQQAPQQHPTSSEHMGTALNWIGALAIIGMILASIVGAASSDRGRQYRASYSYNQPQLYDCTDNQGYDRECYYDNYGRLRIWR